MHARCQFLSSLHQGTTGRKTALRVGQKRLMHGRMVRAKHQAAVHMARLTTPVAKMLAHRFPALAGDSRRQGACVDFAVRLYQQTLVRIRQGPISTVVQKGIDVVLQARRRLHPHPMADHFLAGRVGGLQVCHMLRGLHGWTVSVAGFVGDGQAHDGGGRSGANAVAGVAAVGEKQATQLF